MTVLAGALSACPLQAVDFERDIQPILKDHCYKCHSGPRAKKKIRYDNVRYFKEVVGTDDHAVVIPGNPDASLMLKLASLPRTATDAMPPPRRGEPMNSAELALLRKWIAEGASFESQPEEPASETTSATEMADEDKLHEWTNSAGNKLQAAFVGLEGDTVKLKKEDGTEFNYPLSKLSSESQQLAKLLAQ